MREKGRELGNHREIGTPLVVSQFFARTKCDICDVVDPSLAKTGIKGSLANVCDRGRPLNVYTATY